MNRSCEASADFSGLKKMTFVHFAFAKAIIAPAERRDYLLPICVTVRFDHNLTATFTIHRAPLNGSWGGGAGEVTNCTKPSFKQTIWQMKRGKVSTPRASDCVSTTRISPRTLGVWEANIIRENQCKISKYLTINQVTSFGYFVKEKFPCNTVWPSDSHSQQTRFGILHGSTAEEQLRAT